MANDRSGYERHQRQLARTIKRAEKQAKREMRRQEKRERNREPELVDAGIDTTAGA